MKAAGIAATAGTLLASAALGGIAIVAAAVTGGASSAALTSLELASQACTVTGPVQGLAPAQAANAEAIVSTALADSGENHDATQLALMVAYTESSLQNLGPMPDNDGSLGLFQQRVSQGWGTAAQELDPAEATAMFMNRLLAIKGWQSQPPWQVAQQVQRSAFTDGSNYQPNWPVAGQLLASVITTGSAPGGCGQGVGGGEVGPASSYGLPSGYSIPAGTTPKHAEAVAFAILQLGKRYVWAAAGPATYDCSGLTMASWAAAGVRLDHYTVDQLQEGRSVPPADVVAGDLVLVPGSDPPGPDLPGHVGIYLGYGLVESAIDTDLGVAVQSWQTFISAGLDGVVDPAPNL